MYKRLSKFITGIMLFSLIVTGCTSQASNIGLAKGSDKKPIDTGFVLAEAGSYDSADTAVVLSISPDIGYITFMNIATGKQYTLSYDGTTYVKDKSEGPMAMSQIKKGDIVDITFLKGKKRLASVQLSPQAWVFKNVENYDLGGINHTARIGSGVYSLPAQAVIFSEDERAELMEVVDKDVLKISGIGHEIYSIIVERGHGYLRLSNEQALVGGWIEVGNAAIRTITEDMLLVVPEGSYQVVLVSGDASIVKDVEIKRNKEVILDVGDVKIAEDKKGIVLFSVIPDTADVSIDGEPVDISKEVELDYGIHKVRLEAEGYRTLTKYIQVGAEYASIKFTMEEIEEDSTEDDSYNNSISDNDAYDEIAEAENSTDNIVYIDSPKEVEVYLDDSYVGISPTSFKKVTGNHTIVLRKTGYQSKSYTIYLYDDGQDITYSFPELEAEDDGDDTSGGDDKKNKADTSDRDDKGNGNGDPQGSTGGNKSSTGNNKSEDNKSSVSDNNSIDSDNDGSDTDTDIPGGGDSMEGGSESNQSEEGGADTTNDDEEAAPVFTRIGRYIMSLFQ